MARFEICAVMNVAAVLKDKNVVLIKEYSQRNCLKKIHKNSTLNTSAFILLFSIFKTSNYYF